MSHGGRYDKLLMQFGKDAPAVGFVIVVDQLMVALSRQKIDVPVVLPGTMILFEQESRTGALWLAKHFRRQTSCRCSFSLTKAERTLEDYQDIVCGTHHHY